MSPQIRELLDRAYRDFHTRYHRGQDPVSLVHEYASKSDQEVVAFFCALLAYGNVKTILSSCRRVLGTLGPFPAERVRTGERLAALEGFRHRFTTADDLHILASWLGSSLRSHGTLEAFFVDSRVAAGAPMRERLSDFVIRFTSQALPERLAGRRPARERNLKYLVSDPLRGSACKRLNMFLRWVVRPQDGIDLGLWTRLRTDELMLPIDTHLLQTLRALRWTRSKQATWRVVEAATARLKRYEPSDPVRYDFALCHLSMSGNRIKKYGGARAKVE